MPCGSHGQGKGKAQHLSHLLQVAVDGVDGRVVLPPLFLRVFHRDNRKKERSAGAGVFVHDVLQVGVPANVFLPVGDFRHVGQAAVLDVVFRQIEQVAAGHAFGEYGEKEEVAGKDDGGMKSAQVQIAQPYHLFGRQPVLVFLCMVAYVHALERMALTGHAVGYGQLVHPFQVADIKRDGISP